MKCSVVVGIGVALSWGLMAAPAHANECNSISNSSQRFNTFQQGNVTILGQATGYPYVVVVPGDKQTQLQTVRKCVSDAFVSSHRLGAYIHAGSFRDYATAKRLEIILRSQKLDARVVYFRGRKL
ncbi:MAG TPA: hypothetical protein VK203_20825 [Nostocaceae cyanobacterium]|nr:hypothetical protein [Nostocaceae cyanobacterium]